VGVLEEAAVEALGEAEELRDAAGAHLEARRAAEQQVGGGRWWAQEWCELCKGAC
jgi:hypothetical protein